MRPGRGAVTPCNPCRGASVVPLLPGGSLRSPPANFLSPRWGAIHYPSLPGIRRRLEIDLRGELDDPARLTGIHIADLAEGVPQLPVIRASGRINTCSRVTHIRRIELLLRVVIREIGSDVPRQPAVYAHEVRVIEGVEHLEPDLDAAVAVTAPEREVLVQRDVMIVHARVGHVIPGTVARRPDVGQLEHARVKPLLAGTWPRRVSGQEQASRVIRRAGNAL